MTTASSVQYEIIFSTSFPANAASAHSASRLSSVAASVLASNVPELAAVQAPQASAAATITIERAGCMYGSSLKVSIATAVKSRRHIQGALQIHRRGTIGSATVD